MRSPGFSERADFAAAAPTWLVGEVDGDYRHRPTATLDAVTNYELYKALHSSHNDRNYFELYA
jgi:hypothetical protein